MRKTIFFSDIMGTIFGNSINTEEDYDRLNELLKKLKEKDESDEIVFSLISTDNRVAVQNAQDILRPYIQETVTFGRQYFDKGYFTDNKVVSNLLTSKATHMINYLNELEDSNDEVVSIYFADDVEMYHVMLEHLLEKPLSDRLHSIIPIKRAGLSETNELLERDIEKTNASCKHL